ncbi:hypothetical protein FQZ97_750380 [compost metagenome]
MVGLTNCDVFNPSAGSPLAVTANCHKRVVSDNGQRALGSSSTQGSSPAARHSAALSKPKASSCLRKARVQLARVEGSAVMQVGVSGQQIGVQSQALARASRHSGHIFNERM